MTTFRGIHLRGLALAGLLAVAALPSAAHAADPTGFQAYKGVRISGDNPKVEPQSTSVPYSGAPLALRPSYIGRDAAEPMVALDRDGNAFMSAGAFDAFGSGAAARQELRRSKDGGITWEPVIPPFFTGDGEPTTLDPYVYSDHLTGRIFTVTLLGAGSYLSWTDDAGQTWGESAMSSPGVNDHQSLSTAPPPASLPVSTNDAFPNLVYYCVNHVSDARCERSADGGQTFVPTGGPAFLQTGEGLEGQEPGICSTLHGHLVGDSEGRVFIPAGHCGQPTVAISEDAGLTWQQKVISTKVRSADTHEAMAVDKADNLYYTWMDDKFEQAYLAVSTDHGQSWSEPLMYSPPGIHEVNFPTMTAGDPGKIAITFPATPTHVKEDENGEPLEGEEGGTRPWYSYVVMSTNALDPEPTFLANTGNPANDPVHRGDCGPGRCGGMFDFLEATFSPVDGAVWASATDTCTDSNDCNVDPEIVGNDAEGVAIKQISGPKIVGEGFFGEPGVTPPAPGPAPAQPKRQSAPSARRVQVTCTRARDKKAPARCRVRLPGAPGGTAVSLRLYKKKVLLAGGAVKLKKGRGVIRMKGKKGLKLPIARYNVLVTVSRPGANTSRREKKIKLKNR